MMSLVRMAAVAMMIPALSAAQSSRTPLAQGVSVITNVNVVPMTSDTILRDMNVVVRDGRIAAIGPARSTSIPSNARRIDGSRKYLIPGLADAHAHLYSDDAVADSLASYELGVMLANGVTAARLMIGTPEQLTLRTAVIKGEVRGPQLWLATPQFTGSRPPNARTITSPDDARLAVKEAVDAGYDFIKLTDNLVPEVYEAIMSAAAARRIRVDGHVDTRVGLARALELKQNIQHLDSYFEAVLADSAPSRASLTQGGLGRLQNWKTMDHVDARKIAFYGGATARAGIWSTPTLTVFNKAFAIGFTDDELQKSPDWSIMPTGFRDLYMRARQQFWRPANDSVRTPERRRKYVEARYAMTKAIADSGGKILAGSDAPDLLLVYGYTLHREMASLVEAGLTPYQALAAATRNPAEYFGGLKDWGTIETGKRADLVLLSANPRENIANTARIEWVALAGAWMDRAELDRMVAAASARINNK